MKPTPPGKLYKAAGFSDPESRRAAYEQTEKFKQNSNERHAICGPGRFTYRKRFLNTELT